MDVVDAPAKDVAEHDERSSLNVGDELHDLRSEVRGRGPALLTQYWRRALIRIVLYSWRGGAYPCPFGEVGGPVAASVAGAVDGGLDMDAGQAGPYRGFSLPWDGSTMR